MFLFFIEGVRGRSEIGVPRIFFGGERLFPGLQAAGFFQAGDGGGGDLCLRDQEIERKGAARGGEDFADFFFRRIGGGSFGCDIPRHDFLGAGFTASGAISGCQVASANKFFRGSGTSGHAGCAGFR